MKSLLNSLFVVFFLQIVNAQFPVDGQYQSIAPPTTPVMPNIGQSVQDNSVPSPIEITRVTDVYNYIDGNGDPQVWYPTHEYSKTQVWNADQTRYKIASWKVYNATTYQEEQSLSSMYPSYWSNTDADVIWSFRENGDIKKYNVSTNITQTVASISGYEIIKLGPGEGNIDKNDHYVALVGKKENEVGSFDLDIIIFDLLTYQIVTTRNFPDGWSDGANHAPKYVDWVSVSQSGDFVVIMWNHSTATDNEVDEYIENGNLHYGVEVYNSLDMQFQNRIIRYGNHGDLGYAIDGSEVLVQFYGQYGGGKLYMHKLDGSQSSIVLTTNVDFGVYGHISCRNINRPGWAYITHSLNAQTGQMVAVKLDDSGIVEHFGHHFSSAGSYAQASMAVASPDGDKICFKSDFGTGVNNGDITYSFFATLSSPLSVEEELLTKVIMYPNPTTDFIKIEGENNIKKIVIYNEIGQFLENVEIRNNTDTIINIKHLKKGIYFVRISFEKNAILKKIVKK